MSASAVQALREIESMHNATSEIEIEHWSNDQAEGEYKTIRCCDTCGTTHDGEQLIYYASPCPTLRAACRALAELGALPSLAPAQYAAGEVSSVEWHPCGLPDCDFVVVRPGYARCGGACNRIANGDEREYPAPGTTTRESRDRR